MDGFVVASSLGIRNYEIHLQHFVRRSNPDAVGARITWEAGDLKRSQQKVGGGSYLSSHDPRILLGLGPRRRIDQLEIRWPQPSDRVDTFKDVAVDRYITIVEGAGIKG